jgi:hypothetical protein
VYITPEEHVSLIGKSSRENVVHARFGGGRVWLENVPGNSWIWPLLSEWRGLNVSFDY